jgi:hypothetical protein
LFVVDVQYLFFAEVVGAVSTLAFASAASLASRSAFRRAVLSIRARLAAAYSATAFESA